MTTCFVSVSTHFTIHGSDITFEHFGLGSEFFHCQAHYFILDDFILFLEEKPRWNSIKLIFLLNKNLVYHRHLFFFFFGFVIFG